MTSRRPSLLQARGGSHAHAHAHSSYKLGHGHGHDQHLHQQYPHDAVAGPRPDAVKPESPQEPELLHDRAAVPAVNPQTTDATTPSATSLVTRVVQTVSVVQIVDSSGSPIETQTRLAIPNTVVVDKDTGKTISASNPDPTPAPAAPGSGPEPSGEIRPSMSSISSQSPAASVPSSSETPAASVPSSSQTPAASIPTISISPTSPASLSPSAHSSPPPTPAAPSLGIGHNGTNIHHSTHHKPTNSLFHAESINATHSSTKHSSTKTHPHTSLTTTESSTSAATSFSDTVLSTVSSFEPLPTDAAFGGVIGGDGVSPTTSSTEATPSASSNGTDNALSPQQKQVIGGVVGGLAGAAFFLVLVLLALRYKRRQLNAAQSAGQPSSEDRGLPPTIVTPGGAPSGDSGSGGAMKEKYGVITTVTGVASKSSSGSADSAETGEKSFYRVTGRKLPSVLHVGGDGYSDPRASFMSSTSDYYRGSQAFDPVGGAGARLQLGVPMRPDSGVPIVRSGPARAVVAEPNPFSDPPKTPPADASAPPLTWLRESPSRGSRFQESI